MIWKRSFRECGPNCNIDPWEIPYYGQDHNYVDGPEQGEDLRTFERNYPAMIAAQTAGGVGYGPTLSNGINKTYPGNRAAYNEINPRYRKLFNGREEEAYHHESVCDILSRLSYRRY